MKPTLMNRMNNGAGIVALTAALLLTACAQPDDAATGAQDTAPQPAKVTADDYRRQPTPAGDGPLASVDAAGNVAPFGMASRAPREVAPAPAPAAAAAAGAAAQPLLAAAADPAIEAPGAAVYGVHCIACHGADARGVQGLGLNLVDSQLVDGWSTAEMVAFLQAGRGMDSPDNQSGVPMPAFSWMPAADLEAVSEYVQSL
jgi:mono/diheme cytochrome c family protein